MSASVRGIGVAVITSTCGERSPRPCRASAARWQHAEAVLLVDHDERRGARNAHVLLHQRVRADHQIDLAGARARARTCASAARGTEAVSSAMRRARRAARGRRGAAACARAARRAARWAPSAPSGGRPPPPRPRRATRHGLAAADVALQQAVHRMRPREVGAGSRPRRARCARVSRNGSASTRRARARPPLAIAIARLARRAARGAARGPARAGTAPRARAAACAGVARCAQRLGIGVERRAVELAQRLRRAPAARARATSAAGSWPVDEIGVLRDGALHERGAACAGGTPSGARSPARCCAASRPRAASASVRRPSSTSISGCSSSFEKR